MGHIIICTTHKCVYNIPSHKIHTLTMLVLLTTVQNYQHERNPMAWSSYHILWRLVNYCQQYQCS